MPRLRRIKLYEPIIPDYVDDPEEPDDETSVGQVQNDGSVPEQRGWWSDAAVIATFSDAKLVESADRYSRALALCNTEIARRRLTPTRVGLAQTSDIRAGGLRLHRLDVGADAQRQSYTSRRRTKTQDNKAALTPQQMLQALQMLEQLRSKT